MVPGHRQILGSIVHPCQSLTEWSQRPCRPGWNEWGGTSKARAPVSAECGAWVEHMDPGAGLNKSLPLPEPHTLLHVRVREGTVDGLNDTPSSYLPGTGTLRKQLWMKCEKRKQNWRDLYNLIWRQKQTSFSFFFCALSFYCSLFTGPTNVTLYPDLLFLYMLACRQSCHMSVRTQISFSSP